MYISLFNLNSSFTIHHSPFTIHHSLFIHHSFGLFTDLQIDIHPNTHIMMTASLGRSVRLFDIRKLPSHYIPHFHERIKEAPCEDCLHDYIHPLSVNSAFFNQSGEMIVTTCQDNFLRVYPTVTTPDGKEPSVRIQHRNNTGKWLTKLMAEWYKPSTTSGSEEKSGVQYFTCGSMDEPRQVNVGLSDSQLSAHFRFIITHV